MPIIAGGWPAIQRGLPQSAIELELAMPGSALAPFLGFQMRGALAPIAQRATPLPAAAQFGLGAAIGAVAAYLATRTLTAAPAVGRVTSSENTRQIAASRNHHLPPLDRNARDARRSGSCR
jgi:hypothetical protein